LPPLSSQVPSQNPALDWLKTSHLTEYTSVKGLKTIQSLLHLSNANKQNLLHLAAKAGDLALIQVIMSSPLLNNQLKHLEKDADNQTPFLVAIRLAKQEAQKEKPEALKNANNFYLCAALLLQRGQDPIDLTETLRFNDSVPKPQGYLDKTIKKSIQKGDLAQLKSTLLLNRPSSPDSFCGWDWDTADAQAFIFLAIHSKNSAAVEILCAAGAPLESPSQETRLAETPLLMAARLGNWKCIDILLKAGAQVNVLNAQNRTPFFLAALYFHRTKSKTHAEDFPIILSLMNKANPAIDADADGTTALHLAASDGKCDMLTAILEQSPLAILLNNKKASPLHIAAIHGHLHVAEILLNHALTHKLSLINATDEDEETALFKAASQGHSPMVKLLLKMDAHPNILNKEAKSALHRAASRGYHDIVCLLINFGANIHQTNQDKQSALHLAIANHFPAIVQTLLENEAQVNIVDAMGWSPLFLATSEASKTDNMEIIRLLLEKEPNLQLGDRKGTTPVHLAARMGRIPLWNAFLGHAKTSDFQSRDRNHYTPLHVAALNGRTFIVISLLQEQVDINALTENQDTALHLASRFGHTQTVIHLLKTNVQVHLRNRSGATALIVAACENFAKVVAQLLEVDPDIDASDREGNTALHFAVMNKNKPMIRMLLKKKASTLQVNLQQQSARTLAQTAGDKGIIELLVASEKSEK
jgi:ankyrin repeat protein